MPTVLITGANRGIGKCIADAYAEDGWTVISACRRVDDPELTGEPVRLDLAESESIGSLARILENRPIDVLWNNAGVYLDKCESLDRGILDESIPLSEVDWNDWSLSFLINTVAPLRLCNALMANVLASEQKTMAFTTSYMGSISCNTGGSYAYRSSKAALNMAVDCLMKEYAESGLKTVLLHPGWVRTKMGGPKAEVDPQESAEGMRQIVANLSEVDCGSFLTYDGSQISW